MQKFYIKYGNYFLNVLRAPACGAELCINHCESAEHGAIRSLFMYVAGAGHGADLSNDLSNVEIALCVMPRRLVLRRSRKEAGHGDWTYASQVHACRDDQLAGSVESRCQVSCQADCAAGADDLKHTICDIDRVCCEQEEQ